MVEERRVKHHMETRSTNLYAQSRLFEMAAPWLVKWVEAEDEQDNKEDPNEEQYVFGIDGGASIPFMMKGKINRIILCLLIDSVTFNGYDEMHKILHYDVLIFAAEGSDLRRFSMGDTLIYWRYFL